MADDRAVVERGEAPYAALWQFQPGRGTQQYVQDQVGTWLRERGVDVDLGDSGVHRFGETRLFVGRHESRSAPEFQVRLVEHNTGGSWRTELTTRWPDREAGWLRLRVTNDRGAYVAPPRLASYLLANGEFQDGGSLDLTERPMAVTSADVEAVAEVITDFTREGLVFVAGTDEDLAFDPFRTLVGTWTRDVVGLAEVYVLNPSATRDLAEILGEDHAVRPWTIRTFLPDVDPAVVENARLHRWLGTDRLALWPKSRIQRTLGRVARGHADARELPESVMHSLRAFVRLENQLLVESVGRGPALKERRASAVEGPDLGSFESQESVGEVRGEGEAAAVGAELGGGDAHIADEAAEYLRTLELVRHVLDVPEVTEESLRDFLAGVAAQQQTSRVELGARLAEQEEEIARLSEDLAESRRLLVDAELDMAILQEERDDLADTEQWLRRQFRFGPLAYLNAAPLPDEERTRYPESFAELLEWMGKGMLPHVSFSGNAADSIDLDLHTGMDVSLRTAFDVVLALRDYAGAKAEGWSGNVETYLRTPPDGCRSVAPKKHAANESETVLGNSRLRRMRIFPVPESVDPAGRALMVAHFKLGLLGLLSPRLYYLDDTGHSGDVYIGYVGKHLPNTKTN